MYRAAIELLAIDGWMHLKIYSIRKNEVEWPKIHILQYSDAPILIKQNNLCIADSVTVHADTAYGTTQYF